MHGSPYAPSVGAFKKFNGFSLPPNTSEGGSPSAYINSNNSTNFSLSLGFFSNYSNILSTQSFYLLYFIISSSDNLFLFS